MVVIQDFSGAPEEPTRPPKPAHICRVLLTPEQQEAVKKETGRDMEYVEIPDEDYFISRSMPDKTPDEVTLHAIRMAQIENEWEEQWREYIVELAAWQDFVAAELLAKQQAIEDDAESNAEKLAAEIAAFYEEEQKAMEAAREEALEAWDPKGKKRKKAASEEEDDDEDEEE